MKARTAQSGPTSSLADHSGPACGSNPRCCCHACPLCLPASLMLALALSICFAEPLSLLPRRVLNGLPGLYPDLTLSFTAASRCLLFACHLHLAKTDNWL